MHSERDFLNDLWEDLAGRKFPKPKLLPPPDVLKETQWCPEFEQLMRSRLLMGAFRYGQIKEQDYSKYNLTGEAKRRIDLYRATRNLEFLVDAANMILLAFIHGKRLGHIVDTLDNSDHHTPETSDMIIKYYKRDGKTLLYTEELKK